MFGMTEGDYLQIYVNTPEDELILAVRNDSLTQAQAVKASLELMRQMIKDGQTDTDTFKELMSAIDSRTDTLLIIVNAMTE